MNSLNLVGVGSIFIDDIVLPTGQTFMAQLGGGVVHALMGAALWDERPGIVTLAGYDLPQASRTFLEKHLDTTGLNTLNLRQARAWQLFEEDGSRREVYRTPDVAPYIKGAQPEHFPDAYRHSQAFYLLQGFDGIRAWCDEIGGLILWEPLQQVMVAGVRGELREILHTFAIDVMSPNLAEAQAVCGDMSSDDLITMLFEDGARIVALRMGSEGSIVASRDSRERHHIPAIAVSRVIDQTGAGNTYCGALLLGLMRDQSLKEAGAMAAVAASFCLEQIGVLDPDKVDRSERDRRYQQLCVE